MRTKNLGFRQTGTISLTGRVDNPMQNELSSSRGLHTPLLYLFDPFCIKWPLAKGRVGHHQHHANEQILDSVFPSEIT